MNNNNKNILFYSHQCGHSIKFLTLLKKHTLIHSFNLVDIDVPTNRRQLPRNIKSVPAIVVTGIDRPLIGEEAFFWLQTELNKYSSRGSEQSPSTGDPASIDGMFPPMDSSFSFLDNSMSGTPGNYSYLGSSDSNINVQTDTSSMGKTEKNTGKLSSADYERYVSERNNCVPQTARRI